MAMMDIKRKQAHIQAKAEEFFAEMRSAGNDPARVAEEFPISTITACFIKANAPPKDYIDIMPRLKERALHIDCWEDLPPKVLSLIISDTAQLSDLTKVQGERDFAAHLLKTALPDGIPSNPEITEVIHRVSAMDDEGILKRARKDIALSGQELDARILADVMEGITAEDVTYAKQAAAQAERSSRARWIDRILGAGVSAVLSIPAWIALFYITC